MDTGNPRVELVSQGERSDLRFLLCQIEDNDGADYDEDSGNGEKWVYQ